MEFTVKKKTITIVSAHEGAATWVSVCRLISEATQYQVCSFHQYDEDRYRSSRSTKDRLLHRWRTFVIFPLRFLFHAHRIARESDLLIVDTSPFFLPMLASIMISPRKTKLIALMNDIYPEALVAKGLIKRGGAIERFIKRSIDRAFRKMESVVFISEQHKTFVAKDITLPLMAPIIPGSAHSDPFVGHAPTAVAESLNVMYCGTLGLMHDTATFLNWLECYRGRSNVTFVFYTSGASKPQFERDIRALIGGKKLLSPVCLGNSLSESEWVQVMKRAQVGLVFQDVGSGAVIFPSKIASILASGQAVLAVAEKDSEIGRLILQNDCGWVVEPNDTIGFEACIGRLTDCEEVLRKRINSYKVGHSVFGKDAVAKRWVELFDSTLAQKGPNTDV